MTKYIDAEKLKTEIERLREINRKALEAGHIEAGVFHGRAQTLNYLFELIDSHRQEQPEVDLEKYIENEINHYGLSLYEASYGTFSASQIDRIIRNAFELGQREMRRRITNPEYNAKVVERLKSEYPATKEEKK